MKVYNFLFILIAVFILGGCSQDKGFTIQGKFENAANLTAKLDPRTISKQPVTIASAAIGADGSYKLNVPEGIEAGHYRLGIGSKGIELLVKGDEVITLNGDLAKFQEFQYSITGSELSQTYQSKIQELIARTTNPAQIQEYMKSDIDPLLAMALSITVMQPNHSLSPLYEGIAKKMQAAYPNTAVTASYVDFNKQIKQQAAKAKNPYKVKLGDQAPDIVMEDTSGKTRKLSDLKGKVVLLDFWASWCRPCRMANPKVVQMYDKYNSQGFEVFNVSLDGLTASKRQRMTEQQLSSALEGQKKRWVDAIKKDNLKWDNHVSDLMHWESAGSALYGVSSIPTTFLIDKEGKIAALNPKSNLEEEITKHL